MDSSTQLNDSDTRMDFMDHTSSRSYDEESDRHSVISRESSEFGVAETKNVCVLRSVVIIAIIVAGAISSFFTYENAKNIEIGIPKKEDTEEEFDPIRNGKVSFFDSSKGFGIGLSLSLKSSCFLVM